jgi:hypothetical protein
MSTFKEKINEPLNITYIKEDWGKDGRGRMNLSRRRTAISPEYVPRKYISPILRLRSQKAKRN